MKKYSLMVFILVISLMITACDGQLLEEDGNLEEEESVQYLEPAEGGNLKLAVTRFNIGNPLFNSNKSLQQIQYLMFDGLVAYNNELDIVPALAESWEISSDGESIDFILRKDVKWHDGQSFTADDVIFTYQVIKGNVPGLQGTSVYRASLQPIADMKVIEDDVVRVTFNRPYSNGLEIMTFPILPKHKFIGNQVTDLTNENFPFIGTGPYQLEEHHRMKKIILKRNNNYWGQQPYIDTVEAVIVPDQEAKLSLFENGNVDVVRPGSIDWGRYANYKHVNAYEFISNQYEFMGFNFKNSLLQNLAVRQAFAYGIDRHGLIKNVYLNHATITDVPINPEAWLYNNDAGVKYGYNPNVAIALLEEEGFTLMDNGDYRQNEAGDLLSFKLITNEGNHLREKTAYFIKEEMGLIGINVEIEILDWDNYMEAISRGNFDILLGGWELTPIPDLTFAFHSSQIGGTNYIAYANEEMDQLLENATRAKNRQEKLTSYHLLQSHIANELPYLSLFYQNNAILVKDHVKGDIHPNYINTYEGIQDWFINTK